MPGQQAQGWDGTLPRALTAFGGSYVCACQARRLSRGAFWRELPGMGLETSIVAGKRGQASKTEPDVFSCMW